MKKSVNKYIQKFYFKQFICNTVSVYILSVELQELAYLDINVFKCIQVDRITTCDNKPYKNLTYIYYPIFPNLYSTTFSLIML